MSFKDFNETVAEAFHVYLIEFQGQLNLAMDYFSKPPIPSAAELPTPQQPVETESQESFTPYIVVIVIMGGFRTSGNLTI